jgi:hypothetical protein
LRKRRNIPEDAEDYQNPLGAGLTLESLVIKAQSSNQEEQFSAVQATRKILSKDKNPPIDEIIRTGIVPVLVSCLQSVSPLLQFEAAWALTNIASGTSEQTQMVVRCGAVPLLVQLLYSKDVHVCEQALWALANISGDGPECRDFVVSSGIIDPLLSFVNPGTPPAFLRNVSWTLSNLCRNKNPSPPFESVCKTLPALVYLVQNNDMAVKVDACWALSFLADGQEKQIQVVVDSGVIPVLVPLLAHPDNRVVLPALRTLGNIVTGTDDQTQAVLDGGILLHLRNLVTNTRPTIIREAVWTLSNIVAGNTHQVQMVIDADLVPVVIEALKQGDFRTQKEAAWAVSNFTVGGTPEQVTYLVQQGAVEALCQLLDCKDTTTTQVILDGLANILKMAGANYEVIATQIEEADGLEKIEKLQHHKNQDIYRLAYKIIDKYFTQEGYDDADVMPDATQQGFQFGPTSDIPEGGFQF